MSFVGDLIGDVVGGITGAKQAAKGAERAAATQSQFAQQGIDEQRRQFDKLVELMAPYVTAGQSALGQQQALIGMQGADAQQQAIQGFEQSPLFQSMTQQGENAILQNASATGGLRGGNVQAALSQFRPQVLNALIEQQYGRLGGLSTLGQASAAGQAGQAMNLGANVANLMGQQGAAQAGGQIARAGVPGQALGQAMQFGGSLLAAMGGFGGGAAPITASGVASGGNMASMGGGQGLKPGGSIFSGMRL